eukprot:gene20850-biopygen15376
MQGSVDINKALQYSLSPVPLCLATSDGTRRKTAKSKLFPIALSSMEVDNITLDQSDMRPQCYILDLAATIRSTVKPPNTFRELAKKVIKEVPNTFKIVYIACDTYRKDSIKDAERRLRGEGDKFIIKTPDIRIPSDFKKFLSNGENKERMFELLEDVWVDIAAEVGERIIYVARGGRCQRISGNGNFIVEGLATDHEEADTKIAYLAKHAEEQFGEDSVCVVRSSSGDTDIPVILLAMPFNLHVMIDNGTGKSRKYLDLRQSGLSDIQRSALLGMHAFSGNDYVSSMLRKGKQLCWKHIKDSDIFLEVFSSLGTQMELDHHQLQELEKFVCVIFGEARLDSVNDARKKIFWERFENKKKIVDLSLLPPCQSSLAKHSRRSNYIAYMWRSAYRPMMNLDTPTNHGWLPDLSIDWIEEPYPEDITELLVTPGNDAGNDDFPIDVDDSDCSDSDTDF